MTVNGRGQPEDSAEPIEAAAGHKMTLLSDSWSIRNLNSGGAIFESNEFKP